MRTTDALTTLRADAETLTVTGMAVPYGQVAENTDIGSEAFAPGAFRDSVAKWAGRTDGARMPFRPAHRQPAIGAVTELRETPEGVVFTAQLRDTPAAHDYLDSVGMGLNGVSIEFMPGKGSKSRNGMTLHRSATLQGIAGAYSPAYDGARISLRDMEDTEVTEATEPQAREATEPAVTDTEPKTREAQERATLDTISHSTSSIVITRSELVYGPGKGTSFLQDVLHASHDSAAAERQSRHQAHLTEISRQMERAGDLLQSEIPGLLATEFLPGLLTPAVRLDTPMSSFYETYAISDPRPRTFAKVTTSTAVSTTAKVEGAAPTVTDLATTAVTVTPSVYAAQIDVSREVIDAADPTAEAMLMYDLTARFNETVEAKVATAVEAGSTASGTAITAATPYAGTMGNVNAYYAARYTPAAGQFYPAALYQVLLAQLDTTNRPLIPFIGAFNANGTVNEGGSGAYLNGARIMLSPKSTVNVVVTAKPQDFVIYRSPMLTFRFSEVVGPQSIRIAVFGYLGIGTRLGSLKVTAA